MQARDARNPVALPTVGSDEPAGMRQIGAASFIGTLVEFYDLNIYLTAAALVFPHIFFAGFGKTGATVAAFGSIGVAFVARPLGSILFGHFGDRFGRKSTLVTCLVMMGLATVGVGLLPTVETLGFLAPVLLVTLRVLQGLAAGGEFGGATLFVAESAPADQRGKWASMPIRGGAVATSLAGLTFLLTSLTIDTATFEAWGWRVPFLLSSVLLVVGLYIRLNMTETRVFAHEVGSKGAAAVPFLAAIRAQRKEVLLGCLIEVPAFALLYIVLTYVMNYGANDLKLGYSSVLTMTVVSGMCTLTGATLSSNLSDRLGRRPVLIAANCAAMLWVVALFPILQIGTITTYASCVVVSAFINGSIFGPIGAFMSELFQTRYRYTALGLCYSAAGILGGAVPPLFAGRIIATYGSLAFGGLMALIFAASVLSVLALRETRGISLEA